MAHTSNPTSQQFVVEENAFPVLIHLLRNHPSLSIKVSPGVSRGESEHPRDLLRWSAVICEVTSAIQILDF